MYTDSTELHIDTEYTLLDRASNLGSIILQCEYNVSQCDGGMPEGSIASIWEQVKNIEKLIDGLAAEEPEYRSLPAYKQHCNLIKKIKETLLKYEETKEHRTMDSEDPISLTTIKKWLHSQLAEKGFHLQQSSDPLAFIASSNLSTKLCNFVKSFYLSLPPEGKPLFVEQLVPQYIIMHASMSQIFTFFNSLINVDLRKGDRWTIISLAKGLNEDPAHLSQKFQALSEEKSVYKKNLLMEFIGFGNVTKLGGLLTCAQLASRKSYPIDATLLEENEFKDYFQLFQQYTAKSKTEHFAIVGAHWLSGVIEKLSNGQVRMLVIDVLGSKDTHQYSKPVIDVFFQVFPQGKIFHNNEKLQRSQLGCSIFSLEHLRHFPKIGFYLHMPLLQYFSEQKTLEVDENKRVKFCHLPLSLLRVMEDNALHKEIIPGRDPQERESKIIKKGKTAAQCVEQDFIFDPAASSLRNKRIGLIKDKFFTHNQQFLSSRSEEEIKQLMQNFTLDGFRQRIASYSEQKLMTLERTESAAISSTAETFQSSAYNPYRLPSGPTHQRMSDDASPAPEPENGWGNSESAATNNICAQGKSTCIIC